MKSSFQELLERTTVQPNHYTKEFLSQIITPEAMRKALAEFGNFQVELVDPYDAKRLSEKLITAIIKG